MSVNLVRHRLEVEAYHRMIEVGILTEQDRVELIHGEIIQMSPIGRKHIAAVNRISNLLKKLMGDQAIVSVQNPIPMPHHSEPEPDIALLKPSADFYASAPPRPEDILLLIEVADTPWHYEYDIKRPLYAAAGVQELWLVNLCKHEIEIHQVPATDIYKHITIVRSGDKVAVPGSEISISMDDLLGPPDA